MIYKCRTCNSALEYSAALDKMECKHCGNLYEIGELDTKMEQETYVTENVSLYDEDTIRCKIYSCTSCGAEILVNDVEVSTFCAYCGQPTILFSRVSNVLKPKYIVPFRINKQQAMNRIRNEIHNSRFAPEQIKQYSVEKIRGIYIPYRLYDVDYYDNQVWEHETPGSGLAVKKIYDREARYTFKDLPICISSRLHTILTERIEPFDLHCKKPFEPDYLSGYYTDRWDRDGDDIAQAVDERAKELFDWAVKQTLNDPSAELTYSMAKTEILKSEYILLPAWFMTFRYHDEPYTFIVNGQTGKVVGSLPLQKSKVNLLFALISLITCLLSILFLWTIVSVLWLVKIPNAFIIAILGFISIWAIIPYLISYITHKSMKRVHNHTQSQEVVKYVRERQDRT